MASKRLVELLALIGKLLQELARQDTPPPRPTPARTPERRVITVTEADMARRFIPYEAPRQWTVDARWFLDRRR
jgi:hypothetical protein